MPADTRKSRQSPGRLMDREQVAAEMLSTICVIRDTLLAFPDKTAPMLVGVTDVHEARQILRQQLKAAMEQAVARILARSAR